MATLKRIYKLPESNSMLEFLTMLALLMGPLLKGGTPNLPYGLACRTMMRVKRSRCG